MLRSEVMIRPCVLVVCAFVALSHGALSPNVITKKPSLGEYATTSPLILTPLINQHKYSEAKDAAKVTLLNITSYSGFLTVDAVKDNNLYFWYFPAQIVDSSNAPTIVWLQGGPGASSLYGLFEENGPYIIVNNSLATREFTWNLRHNMLYFDNPVGTGYSYTSKMGYRTNQDDIANDLLEAITQLSTLFPEIEKNPLYISGESYGGKYVPAFADTILKRGGYNLEGVMIANGWISPSFQVVYSTYLEQNGLLGSWESSKFKSLESDIHNDIYRGYYESGINKLADLIINFGDEPKQSLFNNYTGYHQFYDLVEDANVDLTSWSLFVQTAEMRDQMHVGNAIFNSGALSKYFLKNDILNSTAPQLINLLSNGTKVLLFHGQLDIICAYPMMEKMLLTLNWDEMNDFKKTRREKWYVNDQLAGYKKEHKNLSLVLVRLATHMATKDQPEWVLDLIENFIQSQVNKTV